MKKFNPEMKVVRFGNEDVIVTSGAVTKSFTSSGFGDGQAANAVVNFNGTDYILSSEDAVTSLISTMGVKNPGIATSATATGQSLKSTFNVEAKSGANGKWNGTFVYDANATWNNGTKDIKGVFIKQ